MIIILDLDATLLNSKSELTPKTIETLKKAKELGHTIVVNTARNYYQSKEFADAISADYINCFSGNMVVDNKTSEIISIWSDMNSQNFGQILDEFKKIGSKWLVVDGPFNTLCNDAKTSKQFDLKFEPNTLKMLKQQILRLVFNVPSKQEELGVFLAKKYGFKYWAYSKYNFITLTPPNSDKWNGLELLLKHLNSSEKTIAFGDDIIDIKTLQNVDIPVAMANSCPELLAVTKNIALSNNEDGVAVFLEKYL